MKTQKTDPKRHTLRQFAQLLFIHPFPPLTTYVYSTLVYERFINTLMNTIMTLDLSQFMSTTNSYLMPKMLVVVIAYYFYVQTVFLAMGIITSLFTRNNMLQV